MENTVLQFSPATVLVSGKRNAHGTGTSTLTNIGEVDFICKGVTSSCGCTTPNNIKTGQILKAGESIEITFSRHLTSPGTKYVYVSGNCTTVSLAVAAEIQ
jgi:hypothetical protein